MTPFPTASFPQLTEELTTRVRGREGRSGGTTCFAATSYVDPVVVGTELALDPDGR